MATGSRTRKSPAKKGNGRTKSSPARKSSTNSRARDNTNKRNEIKQQPQDKRLYDEIILLTLFAVAAIVLLSNFKLMGSFGQVISGVTYGLFGVISYVAPIAFFLGAAFYISNKGTSVAKVKGAATVVLILVLCSFAQMISYSDIPADSIFDYYSLCADNKTGGGFFGGLITYPLCANGKGIGIIGTYIILVVLLIGSAVLISEKSFFSGVKRGGRVIRDDVNRRRELHQIRVHNAELERQERMRHMEPREPEIKEPRFRHKVSGVMTADPLLDVRPLNDASFEVPSQPLPMPQMSAEAGQAVTMAAMQMPAYKNNHSISYPGGGEDYTSIPIDLNVVNEALSENNKSAAEALKRAESRKNKNRKRNDDMHEVIIPDDDISIDDMPFGEGVPLFGETYDFSPKPDRYSINNGLANSHLINPDNVNSLKEGAAIDTVDEDVISKEAYEMDIEEAAKDINIRIAPDKPTKSAASVAKLENEIVPPALKPQINNEAKKKDIIKKASNNQAEYQLPPIELLNEGTDKQQGNISELQEMSVRLEQTLKNFGINVSMTDVIQGPTVTRYEMKPAQGVKVSKITNLADDICLNMEAKSVRIEAPIPGKAAVGIEIPNKKTMSIMFRDLVDTDEFRDAQSKLTFAVGKDIGGQVICADIAKMPHLLIAGATGSGKSVCINTLIMSILYKAKPDEVKLIMVDPKVVELSVYNGIPHLMVPVVTDPKKAAAALNWGVSEMMDRYSKFAEFGVRDLKGYNKKVETVFNDPDIVEEDRPAKMPQIIIIVDELADLMMVASKDVEASICRLAQLARAAGIHLVIATQRPSVDVITGLIKANMPSRVAFRVSSGIDSRTILDMTGAEKLLGNGDMLFYPQGYSKPARVQGAFVSDKEVADVVEFLKNQCGTSSYDSDVEAKIAAASSSGGTPSFDSADSGSDRDDLYIEAGKFIIDTDKASIGALQRKFKIGFNRAARIMDQLADDGIVSEGEGTKPRTVVMSMEQFEEFVDEVV